MFSSVQANTSWIPAFAGMTIREFYFKIEQFFLTEPQ